MSQYEYVDATPDNITELVKKAGDNHSWENRLEAVGELRKWRCQQSVDVITRLALRDKVFAVKEEAFRVAQAFGVKKGGKAIYLGRKEKPFKNQEITKVFQRVIREMKKDNLTVEEFKAKFSQVNPEMYDVMGYEKRGNFNEWIDNVIKSLPKK
ncbi:MAG: HEAT repeat domain-containing protein [Syntrophomonadaceae bacterium]|nr:HEAT repeat domain-containing protein [Syntrophomonadaceae bacterium]